MARAVWDEPDRWLLIVVIYHNPADYPGRFVARRHWAGRGEIQVDAQPLIVADSLTEARSIIPSGMMRLPRADSDEPQVVESWI